MEVLLANGTSVKKKCVLIINFISNIGYSRSVQIGQLSQTIEELEEKMGKVQDRITRTRVSSTVYIP